MPKLLRGRGVRVRWTGLLVIGLICWPLTVFAATPTPPTNQPGQATTGFPPGIPPGFQPGFPPSGPGFQAPVSQPGGRMGPTDPQQTMVIGISLKVTDQRGLDSFLHDLYDPASPQFHHFLSPPDFTKRFLASGRQAVGDFLRGAKLSVTDRGIGSIINATGTVDQMQTAFKVTISNYADPSGSVYAAADMPPTIPPAVSGNIQAIVGLDNVIQINSHLVVAPPPDTGSAPAATAAGATGCDAALSVASTYGAYTPNQIGTAYNFNAFADRGEQGQGQIIAVMAVDDFRDANIAAYQSCFGTSVTVTRVPVDGGTHVGPFVQEVELDLQVLIGMLPKLQQLLVYESDYRITAILDSLQMMANDNVASVVSISFGGCEQNRNVNTFLMPENTIFEQMAAQGMSVFAASGDSGSRDCLLHHTATANSLAVDDPASQPYVTGVGGTKLTIDPATNAYSGETVWNGFSTGTGAGGGGLSAVWPQQDYQTGPGVANSFANGKRQVPDVSANADPKAGFVTYTTDPTTCPRVTGTAATTCFMATGGTSAAAPLWAAAATLTNQRLAAGGYPRLGFVNPLVYRLASGGSGVFHDITTGHNCFDASCDGAADPHYPATPGFDMASGVGTFDAGAFADAALSTMPHITGTAPMSGPELGLTTVTFTGTNFQTGATVSFGGAPALSVRVPDSKTITVVTPPHLAGAVDVEIVTGGIRFVLTGGYTYVKQPPPTAAPPPTGSPPPSPP